MGKIYYMMGKSSSGKDTLFQMLIKDSGCALSTIVPYTTRPMRDGERDGVEYYFCEDAKVQELQEQGRLIELRSYQTVQGVWHYFTAADEQVDLQHHSYLMIGTLESYLNVREYYGKEHVFPIYIEVEDGVRLQRALDRERKQKNPAYEELCRRFLADAKDFSEEKLREAEITRRFCNVTLPEVLQEIKAYIAEQERC